MNDLLDSISPDKVRLLVIAVAGALLSLAFSKERRVTHVLAGVGAGVFASYLFTEPTLEWFSLLPVYRDAIAGVYGLIGYNVLKRVSDASSSSTSVIEAVKQIIGGQKK